MKIKDFKYFGATERIAGALRNLLDYEGVISPHTNEPLTESILMGIGGGLGAEYAAWAFKPIDPSKPRKAKLYLRFHHVKNYIEKKENTALHKIANRIGAKLTVTETVSNERADQFLLESIQMGKPVIVSLSVWHDLFIRQNVYDRYHQNPSFFPPLLYDEYLLFLPYYTLPYGWINSHLATVFGFDEETNQIHLTDWSTQPHTITFQQFTESRGIIKGWKNRSITLDPPSKLPTLEKAVRAGIRDCVQSLLHEKRIASGAQLRVDAWRIIAAKLADAKGKRGWITLFDEPWQIFNTLTRLHAQIAFYNSDGSALRSSYGDFLVEVSEILKKPTFKDVASQFYEVGVMWDEIGSTVLPDDISIFQKTRLAAIEWNNIFRIYGQSKSLQLKKVAEKIKALRNEAIEAFPLTKKELLSFFEILSSRFYEVYEAEKAALVALRKLVK